MASKTAQEMIADWLRATLKPGDTVFLWTGNSVTVQHVNRKSITTVGDVKWSYGDITPANAAGEMMTPKEAAQAFLAWQAQQS